MKFQLPQIHNISEKDLESLDSTSTIKKEDEAEKAPTICYIFCTITLYNLLLTRRLMSENSLLFLSHASLVLFDSIIEYLFIYFLSSILIPQSYLKKS